MMKRRDLPSANALAVFELAARLGNFSRSAEALNISQPAVSHTISTLEEHLQVPLFHRSGPKLQLTEAGERLSRVTTQSFQAIEEVVDDIRSRDNKREVIMLSLSSALVMHWLMPRYEKFRKAFRNVDLQFQLSPVSVGGPISNCDLGLRLIEGKDRMTVEGSFAPERILAVCAKSYLREHGPLEAPIREHTLIQLREHWFGWPEFSSKAGFHPSTPPDQISFSDYSMVIQAAISGQGVALGWTSVVSQLVTSGALVQASPIVIETERSYHLVPSSQRPMRPIVKDVRDWMIKEMNYEQKLINDLLMSTS